MPPPTHPPQLYSTYARSHLYYAFELVFLCVVLALVDTTVGGCRPGMQSRKEV